MEKALRECCRSIRIGKLLMVRDEDTMERHVRKSVLMSVVFHAVKFHSLLEKIYEFFVTFL